MTFTNSSFIWHFRRIEIFKRNRFHYCIMCCDYQSLEEFELEYKKLLKKDEKSKKEIKEEKPIILTA